MSERRESDSMEFAIHKPKNIDLHILLKKLSDIVMHIFVVTFQKKLMQNVSLLVNYKISKHFYKNQYLSRFCFQKQVC